MGQKHTGNFGGNETVPFLTKGDGMACSYLLNCGCLCFIHNLQIFWTYSIFNKNEKYTIKNKAN